MKDGEVKERYRNRYGEIIDIVEHDSKMYLLGTWGGERIEYECDDYDSALRETLRLYHRLNEKIKNKAEAK